MSTFKKVKFDFYTIDVPENTDLLTVLDASLPVNVAKAIKYKDQYIRLENYRIEGNIRIGSITKINIESLPSKVKINKPGIQDLGLEEDEGVASLTSFVLIPHYRSLVLQRNQQGVRAGSFVHLLEHLTSISGFGLNIMLERTILNKLNRMQYFSKFKMKIANPLVPADYNELSVKEAATLARHYNARNVTLELGIGTGSNRSPLYVQKVKETINTLLRRDNTGPVVESLIVRGKEFDDDKIEALDLIKQRLISEIDIPLTGRTFSQENLERAAWSAYKEKKDEIEHYRPL